jgi:hypothetical protein
MTDTAIGTGIRVTATHKIFFIIAAILYKPVVKVDGTAHKIGWNDGAFIATTAGSHEIEVFYKLYWVIPVAKRKTTVNVAEGSTVTLKYDLSLFSYSAKLAAA